MSDYLYHYVEIYETLLFETLPGKIIADNFLIEFFSEGRNYHITYIDITPQPMVKLSGNEVQIQGDVKLSDIKNLPADPAGRSKYIAIWSRFPALNGDLNIKQFHDEIAKAITLFSILNKADQVFAKKVLSGFYVEPGPYQSPPIKIKAAFKVSFNQEPKHEIESSATELAKLSSEMQLRFKLISRFYTKALSEQNIEEKLLWLWTTVEIFPMKNTSDVSPLTKLLASQTKKTTQEVGQKLRPGYIQGIRSNLVHDGELKIDENEAHDIIEKLQLISEVVIRSICGIPYDGRLDHYF